MRHRLEYQNDQSLLNSYIQVGDQIKLNIYIYVLTYKDTDKTLEKNLLKGGFDALKILLKNKDIIVQKANKVNTVVILNRKDYVCEMKNILDDKSKFQKV